MSQVVDRPTNSPEENDRRMRFEEPEVLPLSLAGNWIAWSADGLRIVAYAKTLVGAEELAHAAGEPEPIMQLHPGAGRL